MNDHIIKTHQSHRTKESEVTLETGKTVLVNQKLKKQKNAIFLQNLINVSVSRKVRKTLRSPLRSQNVSFLRKVMGAFD